jgi:hypothetical protein
VITPEQLAAATPERPVRVGRYDVTGLIRRGGMGTVYDAIDRDHGARVALKTLTELAPDGLLRFKNEFRSVADLSHRNLVPLYELGCEGDLWFFTMERVDGVDFVDHLRGALEEAPTRTLYPTASDDLTRRGGRTRMPAEDEDHTPSLLPSIPALRDALAQLVLGVRALHDAGLLHLDLKPSNVLVAGLAVIALGIPPEAVVAAQIAVNEHAQAAAKIYVDMFRDTVWRAFADAGQPADAWPRVQQAVERVQPVASQAMLAAFRLAMAQAVDAALGEELGRG